MTSKNVWIKLAAKQMRFLVIFIVLLLLKFQMAQAIPLCAFEKFNFSSKQIYSSVRARAPPNYERNIFIIDVGPKLHDAYPGRILIFNDQCDLLYSQYLEYYPISVFVLDDGVSGVVFNLTASNSGYVLFAYRIYDYKISVAMNKVISDIRPSFIFSDPSLTAPDVRVCAIYNSESKKPYVCHIYKFNNKKMCYMIFKGHKMGNFQGG